MRLPAIPDSGTILSNLLFTTFTFLSLTPGAAQVDSTHSQDSACIRDMTVEQFNRRTNLKEKLVLVNFSADWCVVCKKQKPALNAIKSYYQDNLLLLEIDMEYNPLIAEYFTVDALPVNLLYKNGEIVWNRVGLQSQTDLLNATWPYRIKTRKK